MTVKPDSLKINVRLTPNASKDAILGWSENADGVRVLKVSVTAVPEKGKANEALIRLLAREWRVPKSSIFVTHGETARNKTLLLMQAPENIG